MIHMTFGSADVHISPVAADRITSYGGTVVRTYEYYDPRDLAGVVASIVRALDMDMATFIGHLTEEETS